jgi:hypothetical protein
MSVIVSEDQQKLGQYNDFVEHNEFELACDALDEAAIDGDYHAA